MDEKKYWLAVYTRPRWEKKVDSTLIRKGIESWCPLHKKERQWSDRKKIIEEPLFKSYVFVHIKEDEKLRVLQTEGILNFVHFLGKPAIIRSEEIELIKSYLFDAAVNVSTASLQDFKENDTVVIRQGLFMDNTGTVMRTGKKRVYVKLESLGQIMIVEFAVSQLSPKK